MTERRLLAVYAALLAAGFAPYLDLFPKEPLFTITWIICDLFALVLLTISTYAAGYFATPDIDE